MGVSLDRFHKSPKFGDSRRLFVDILRDNVRDVFRNLRTSLYLEICENGLDSRDTPKVSSKVYKPSIESWHGYYKYNDVQAVYYMHNKRPCKGVYYT